MTKSNRRIFGMLLGAGMAALAGTAAIADTCGVTRPIKLIVGYGAGGGTDSYARILASVMPEFLDDTPMVVVNKPGGAQVAAMKFVKEAAPDGTTLQVVAMGGGLMSTMLRDTGVSWLEDFVPIAQFGLTNQALVVRRDSDIETTQQLIDFIRQKGAAGERVRWSHPGRGSVSHVGVTAFLEKNGLLEFTQDVPFDGGANTRNALISGEVDFSASGAHTVPAFRDVQHAVGLLAEERDAQVGDIPTLAEQGIEYVPTESPIILAAPAGVDPAFVTCMAAAVRGATEHAAFTAMMKKAEQAVVYRDAPATDAKLRALAAAWTPVIAEVRKALGQ